MRRLLTVLAAASLVLAVPAAAAASPGAGSPAGPRASAAGPQAFVRRVREMNTAAFGVLRPQGIAWSVADRSLLVFGTDVAGASVGRRVSPAEDDLGAVAIPSGLAVRTLSFDARAGRLVRGVVDRAGSSWLLDTPNRRVVTADESRAVDLSVVGGAPTALAIHPVSGNLFVLVGNRSLAEVDGSGVLVSSRDLRPIGLVSPQALVIAPSGDNTDAPSVLSAYVADAGSSGNGSAGAGVVELALAPDVTPLAADATGSLVHTINTFQWSPASPDPSGLAYRPGNDKLIVTDGEVDETTGAGFHGANGWLSSRSGTVSSTFDLTGFNSEAAGVAYDAANDIYYFSNDSGKRVWVVDPGGDDTPGTADDTRSSFLTTGFGANDPEGLAFGGGDLFIASGVDKEIFRIDPGANGTFQGGGDDVITHFDVASMGQSDPEGIDFEASSGHLWVVSNASNTDVLEVTVGGIEVQTVNLDFSVIAPGGLAVAPATTGSGNHVYIADRGVDNNNDPTENDGRIYEVAVSGSTPPPGSGTLALPTNPVRVLDTRIDKGLANAFNARATRSFQVAGTNGIPADAIAITGNLTVVNPGAGGFLSALTAAPPALPNVSNLNFTAHETAANNLVAPLTSNGRLFLTNWSTGKSHVLLDVTGYFRPASNLNRYVDVTPARILDSRNGTGLSGFFTSGVPRTFAVQGQGGIPNDAVAVTGNLTVVQQTAGGFVSLTTNPDATPPTSTINFTATQSRANGIVVRLSAGGSLSAVVVNGTGKRAHLLFDVTGYFTADSGGAIYHVVAPTRLMDTRTDVGVSAAFQKDDPQSLTVSPNGPVPSGAVGVTGNLTVTGQQDAGFVAMTATPDATPETSTLNFPIGVNRANGVVAPLSGGHASFVYKTAAAGASQTELLFDVTGYFD
ncbi:MAG TPA: hypothetical protein VH720_15260 [Candidatus Limnocylindrales bacterium]